MKNVTNATPIAFAYIDFTFLYAAANDWLKLFDSPWSTVEANWKKTFKTRRQQILNSSGSTSANTLRNWKLFPHSCGYNLVSGFLLLDLYFIR